MGIFINIPILIILQMKYEVINGRFAFKSKVYEHGEIVDLSDSEVKRMETQGIIPETLEKFVVKKKTQTTPTVPQSDNK